MTLLSLATVSVVRGNLLEGAIRAFQRKSFDPTRSISVKFMDDVGIAEGAVDGGGPTREFFTFLVQELCRSPIFQGPDAEKMLAPSQKGKVYHTTLTHKLKCMRFVGRVEDTATLRPLSAANTRSFFTQRR